MTSVFVSMPTWLEDKYVEGREGFLRTLKALGLEPRTIGTTDYPSKAPLDGVIKLMDECSGAIILGYPQIIAATGFLKDQPIVSDVALPTEWNHIEAALAYARKIPLLVIHHHGISRGVFDRGAIGNFMYSVDLSKPGWSLEKEVHGAINGWKQDVLRAAKAADKGSAPTAPVRPKLDIPVATAAGIKHFCRKCGAIPGTATTCTVTYGAHDFAAMSDNSFCRRCGVLPGKPSTCTATYGAHDFSPVT